MAKRSSYYASQSAPARELMRENARGATAAARDMARTIGNAGMTLDERRQRMRDIKRAKRSASNATKAARSAYDKERYKKYKEMGGNVSGGPS